MDATSPEIGAIDEVVDSLAEMARSPLTLGLPDQLRSGLLKTIDATAASLCELVKVLVGPNVHGPWHLEVAYSPAVGGIEQETTYLYSTSASGRRQRQALTATTSQISALYDAVELGALVRHDDELASLRAVVRMATPGDGAPSPGIDRLVHQVARALRRPTQEPRLPTSAPTPTRYFFPDLTEADGELYEPGPGQMIFPPIPRPPDLTERTLANGVTPAALRHWEEKLREAYLDVVVDRWAHTQRINTERLSERLSDLRAVNGYRNDHWEEILGDFAAKVVQYGGRRDWGHALMTLATTDLGMTPKRALDQLADSVQYTNELNDRRSVG